ncbi:MAG: Gfo/Idh/MocA family oxidoreductase [Pyrinomonadaceae bacterium]
MKQIIFLFVALTLCSTIVRSQEPVAATTTAAARPLRLAIAGLSHGHVRGILGRAAAEGVQIVGIHETDSKLADRYAQEYKFSRDLVYTDLGKMLDATKPEAVAAFGSTYDHLKVVEASAERGLPVMVEKPLAVSLEHALAIEALAKKHQIHVLTNYETTWYPSTQGVYDLVYGQQAPARADSKDCGSRRTPRPKGDRRQRGVLEVADGPRAQRSRSADGLWLLRSEPGYLADEGRGTAHRHCRHTANQAGSLPGGG